MPKALHKKPCAVIRVHLRYSRAELWLRRSRSVIRGLKSKNNVDILVRTQVKGDFILGTEGN